MTYPGRPPFGPVGLNHLIPSNLGLASHKHSISRPTRSKAQNANQKMGTLTTGLNAQVDRLSVFPYTKTIPILFSKNVCPTWLGSILEKAHCGNLRTSFGKTIPFQKQAFSSGNSLYGSAKSFFYISDNELI